MLHRFVERPCRAPDASGWVIAIPLLASILTVGIFGRVLSREQPSAHASSQQWWSHSGTFRTGADEADTLLAACSCSSLPWEIPRYNSNASGACFSKLAF